MAMEAMHQPSNSGFEGALSGMTLADLIQIKNLNRFTGCLSVEHAGQKGVVFFRDGDLVHAELNEKVGSEAFYTIMQWPGGEFKTDPKIITTCRTINESLTFLLLEAHRMQDEQSYASTTNKPAIPASTNISTDEVPDTNISDVKPEAPPKPEGRVMSDINTKLSAISEVEYAVIQTKDGNPVDDTSYEAATYAANGLYLSILANQIGGQLGTGELISASVHGTDHHLLLFQSKSHYLNITISGASQLGPVEANVRKALTNK